MVPPAPVVVIGIGNPACGDDGAGPAVIQALLEASLPPGVSVIESNGDPGTLLEAWRGAELAILVDAVVSGAAPGTLTRGTLDEMGGHGLAGHRSSHALGLAESVGLGRALQCLPRRIVVLGIEGAAFAAGAPMSPDVRSGVRQAVPAVLAELPGTGPRGAPTSPRHPQ